MLDRSNAPDHIDIRDSSSGDWFDQCIECYAGQIETRDPPPRSAFMDEFDASYTRSIQPLFNWFAFKARTHGLEAGHSISEWRHDGRRIANLWIRVGAAVSQLAIQARSRERDIRHSCVVLSHSPVVMADECSHITYDQVQELLQRFLIAALDSEARHSS